MLDAFIAVNQDEILQLCRAKVARRLVPPVTQAEIDHALPLLLDHFLDALRHDAEAHDDPGQTERGSGHDVLQTLTLSQVVHDYGDICDAIAELAAATETPVSTEDIRTLNGCLDDAMAGAMDAYRRERLGTGDQTHHRERFFVSEFIEALTPAAHEEARERGIRLIAMPGETDVEIEADRQILGAVVSNLLENAYKFTRPRTIVTLRVRAGAERVLIEIEDECGGLPGGNAEDPARPFEQRSADRTGVSLGLAFSRWGAEVNHGRIYARSLLLKGCVFTIDLPRARVPVMARAS